MRYRLRDIPVLVRTPLGRKQLLHGLLIRTTPFFVIWARLHRRIIIHKTKITAVAGSFGKTTATRCILAALGLAEHEQLDGNSGISLAKNILRIQAGDHHAAVEIGISAKGQMARGVDLVRPDIAVVTSIGSEHNRSFKTLEVTRNEKADIVRALDPAGLAVLNGDDPNVLWMAGETQATAISVGFGRSNHFRVSNYRLAWPEGTRFTLNTENKSFEILSPFFGKHMVYPVLAAAAVAHHQGIDPADCLSRIESLKPEAGRMQPLLLDNGAIVLRDDFKSAEETIHTALAFLDELPAKRKMIVLGEVNEPHGNQGEIYRRVGHQLGTVVSKAFLICSRRSFHSYAAGAVSTGLAKKCLIRIKNGCILALIKRLQEELMPGDVLLLKGRHNQRLERIAFALQGRTVNCGIGYCDAKAACCDICPMLETGWSGRKILF